MIKFEWYNRGVLKCFRIYYCNMRIGTKLNYSLILRCRFITNNHICLWLQKLQEINFECCTRPQYFIINQREYGSTNYSYNINVIKIKFLHKIQSWNQNTIFHYLKPYSANYILRTVCILNNLHFKQTAVKQCVYWTFEFRATCILNDFYSKYKLNRIEIFIPVVFGSLLLC